MTREQQEMINREYNEALQANDDQRILRAIGHATVSLVDCQRKTSDRVKDMTERDRFLEVSLETLQHDLRRIRKVVDEDHGPIITEYREGKLKASGAVLLLKILGLVFAVSGSGAIGWFLAVVNKATGVESP